MKSLLLIMLVALTGLNSWGRDLTNDMDALGGNKELINRAKAIDPKNRIRIVQNRAVDRNMRLELGINYGINEGGDPYVDTNNLGASLDFHLTPRWSVGARYYNSSNSLSSEGKRVMAEADAARASNNNDKQRPGIDYVSDTWLGVINWYPMYGKLNFLDVGVSQFDMYVLAGGGQVSLSTGTAPTYTAGGGLGVWINQHFSTRLEARYQGYQDSGRGADKRDINLTVLSASIGFLL